MTRIDIGGVSVPTGHLIGGRRVGSDASYEVISPINGSVLGHIPSAGVAEVDAAVAAARAAFPAWAALG
ncbi:MAG: aldehyde dehydrogenase family protein, partial [Ilumatobacteraceae bacterium]